MTTTPISRLIAQKTNVFGDVSVSHVSFDVPNNEYRASQEALERGRRVANPRSLPFIGGEQAQVEITEVLLERHWQDWTGKGEPQPVRVAAAQMNSRNLMDHNIITMFRLAERASAQGVTLLVLPEHWGRWGSVRSIYEDFDPRALNDEERAPFSIHDGNEFKGRYDSDVGIEVAALSAAAREHGIWIAGNTIEFRPENALGKHFNTLMLFNPTGHKVAEFRKVHPFPGTTKDGKVLGRPETEVVEPGKENVRVKTPFGYLTMLLCHDIRKLHMVDRILTDFIVFAASWRKETAHELPELQQQAALGNGLLISAVQKGFIPPPLSSLQGQEEYLPEATEIRHPNGQVMAEARGIEGNALAIADYDVREKNRDLKRTREPRKMLVHEIDTTSTPLLKA